MSFWPCHCRGSLDLVASGGLKGQRGFFTRDAAGAVLGIDLAGRLATRSA